MTPTWRKSSRSGGSQGGQSDCVQVARLTDAIGLRDSKHPDAGHISISVEDFADLLARAKRDELNL